MDEKDKKEQFDQDELDQKEDKDEMQQIEEEMAKMLQEMENYLGSEVSNVKIVTIDKKQKRKFLIFHILEIVLSVVLLFASIGYLKWVACDKLYQYFILIGGIVLIEYLLRFFIKKVGLKLIILSFGAIFIVAPILAFVISLSFTPGVEVLNYGLLIVVFILYLLIKKVFMSFLTENGPKFIGGIKI